MSFIKKYFFTCLVLYIQAFITLAKDIKDKMDRKNVSVCVCV